MLSYQTRCKGLLIIGIIVFVGFWGCFVSTACNTVIPKSFSLIGIIMGALIFLYALRSAPDKYVPEAILAAEKNDLRYLRFLLKNENIPPGILSIALCEAAKNGAMRTMELLLKNGTDPNHGGYARSLHYAFQRYEKRVGSAKQQGLEAIDLLLKFGADPKLPINSISEPYMLVAKVEKLGVTVE